MPSLQPLTAQFCVGPRVSRELRHLLYSFCGPPPDQPRQVALVAYDMVEQGVLYDAPVVNGQGAHQGIDFARLDPR